MDPESYLHNIFGGLSATASNVESVVKIYGNHVSQTIVRLSIETVTHLLARNLHVLLLSVMPYLLYGSTVQPF